MNDLVQSLKQSPVYQLDGAEPVLTKEYNFADYMVNVVTNLQESKVCALHCKQLLQFRIWQPAGCVFWG